MAWDDVARDPDFLAQPLEVRQRVAHNYFDRNLADQDFASQPQDVQQTVRQKFISQAVAPTAEGVARSTTLKSGTAPPVSQPAAGLGERVSRAAIQTLAPVGEAALNTVSFLSNFGGSEEGTEMIDKGTDWFKRQREQSAATTPAPALETIGENLAGNLVGSAPAYVSAGGVLRAGGRALTAAVPNLERAAAAAPRIYKGLGTLLRQPVEFAAGGAATARSGERTQAAESGAGLGAAQLPAAFIPNPYLRRAASGLLSGGYSAGEDLANGRPIDPARVATSTALGAAFAPDPIGLHAGEAEPRGNAIASPPQRLQLTAPGDTAAMGQGQPVGPSQDEPIDVEATLRVPQRQQTSPSRPEPKAPQMEPTMQRVRRPKPQPPIEPPSPVEEPTNGTEGLNQQQGATAPGGPDAGTQPGLPAQEQRDAGGSGSPAGAGEPGKNGEALAVPPPPIVETPQSAQEPPQPSEATQPPAAAPAALLNLRARIQAAGGKPDIQGAALGFDESVSNADLQEAQQALPAEYEASKAEWKALPKGPDKTAAMNRMSNSASEVSAINTALAVRGIGTNPNAETYIAEHSAPEDVAALRQRMNPQEPANGSSSSAVPVSPAPGQGQAAPQSSPQAQGQVEAQPPAAADETRVAGAGEGQPERAPVERPATAPGTNGRHGAGSGYGRPEPRQPNAGETAPAVAQGQKEEVAPPQKPPVQQVTDIPADYEGFKKQYISHFNAMNQYTPEQVGMQHYADLMGRMSDAHPDWVDQIEREADEEHASSQQKPAEVHGHGEQPSGTPEAPAGGQEAAPNGNGQGVRQHEHQGPASAQGEGTQGEVRKLPRIRNKALGRGFQDMRGASIFSRIKELGGLRSGKLELPDVGPGIVRGEAGKIDEDMLRRMLEEGQFGPFSSDSMYHDVWDFLNEHGHDPQMRGPRGENMDAKREARMHDHVVEAGQELDMAKRDKTPLTPERFVDLKAAARDGKPRPKKNVQLEDLPDGSTVKIEGDTFHVTSDPETERVRLHDDVVLDVPMKGTLKVDAAGGVQKLAPQPEDTGIFSSREAPRIPGEGRVANTQQPSMFKPESGQGLPEKVNPKIGERPAPEPGERDWLDEAADKARKRTAKNAKGEKLRTGPVDPEDIADYATIGAQKIRQGYRDFKAWSAKMLVELGEHIRPHLQAIWERARGMRNAMWYSKMREVLQEKLPGSGSAEDFTKAIEAFARKGEFKKAELEESGLLPWLKTQSGKVTPADVMAHLDEHAIELREVTKRDWDEDSGTLPEGYEVKKFGSGNFGLLDPSGKLIASEFRSKQEILDDLPNIFHGAPPDTTNTKFSQYQLPGGTNYREVLLTLPPRPSAREEYRVVPPENPTGTVAQREWKIVDTHGKLIETRRDEHYAKLRAKELGDISERHSNQDFHSSHFDEPNILAHVRLNDRTAADGKKTLFVEEVQSDWHQKGRKEGYRGPEPQRPPFDEWRASNYTREGHLWVNNANGMQHTGEGLESIYNRTQGDWRDGVPDVPFKKNWHELAMKRVLRMAADEGYDKVAWTTGAQQAERYDLSKQVSAISYFKRDDGTYQLKYIPKGRNSEWTTMGSFPADKLDEAVGKDLAKRIVADEGDHIPHSPHKQFSGIDLKVGGEGMKGFYDKILPSAVNDIAKRMGLGKVGTTQIPVPDGSARQRSGERMPPGSWVALDANGNALYGGPTRSDVEAWANRNDLSAAGGSIEKNDIDSPTVPVHSIDLKPEARAKISAEPMTLYSGISPHDFVEGLKQLGGMSKTGFDYLFKKPGDEAPNPEHTSLWQDLKDETARLGGKAYPALTRMGGKDLSIALSRNDAARDWAQALPAAWTAHLNAIAKAGKMKPAEFHALLGAVMSEGQLRGIKAGFEANANENAAQNVSTTLRPALQTKIDTWDKKIKADEAKFAGMATGKPKDKLQDDIASRKRMVEGWRRMHADSPFETEADVQAARDNPTIQAGVEYYKAQIEPVLTELYKASSKYDKHDKNGQPIPTPRRGAFFGEHTSLFPSIDQEGKGGVGLTAGGNIKNTLEKHSVLERSAKGSGGYVLHAGQMFQNAMDKAAGPGLHAQALDAAEKAGIGVTAKPSAAPKEIAGHPVKWVPRKFGSHGEAPDRFYYRADADPEFRRALAIDKPLVPLSRASKVLSYINLIGVAEGTSHLANNVASAMGKYVGAGSVPNVGAKQKITTTANGKTVQGLPWDKIGFVTANSIAKVPRLIDSIGTRIVKIIAKDPATLDRLAAMVQDAAGQSIHAKGARADVVGHMGRILRVFTDASRLAVKDGYDEAVKLGLLPDNAANRRDYVNQAGNYYRNSASVLATWLKDSKMSPFVTAGVGRVTNQTRTAAVLDPGVATGSVANNITHRFMAAAAYASVYLAVMGLNNYLRTGHFNVPGLPYGQMYLYTNKNGQPVGLPVEELTPIPGMLRLTGLGPLLESHRRGLSSERTMHNVLRSVEGQLSSPLFGPIPSTLATGAAGIDPHGMRIVAPPASAAALKEAGRGLNPLAKSLTSGDEEGMWGMLGKLAPRIGQSPQEMDATRAKEARYDALAPKRAVMRYKSQMKDALRRGLATPTPFVPPASKSPAFVPQRAPLRAAWPRLRSISAP